MNPGFVSRWRFIIDQGPVSISEKTSFRKISWSLEAARFVFRIVWSLWNLTGTSAAVLPMCLSNFKAIRQFKVPISWLRDFTRSYEKTSFRILRRGPGTLMLCFDIISGIHMTENLVWSCFQLYVFHKWLTLCFNKVWVIKRGQQWNTNNGMDISIHTWLPLSALWVGWHRAYHYISVLDSFKVIIH